jgi:hypothetical protein
MGRALERAKRGSTAESLEDGNFGAIVQFAALQLHPLPHNFGHLCKEAMVIPGEDQCNSMPGPAVTVAGADCADRKFDSDHRRRTGYSTVI